MRVLNLGCGTAKRNFPEAAQSSEIIGVDISRNSEADILHDLDVVPWPFDPDSFDLIIMQDIIEHLEDVPATMNEVWRIARHGCIVRIRTPHYASYYAYNDPTHKRFFGLYAFDRFLFESPNDLYATGRFLLVRRSILFPKLWRITGVCLLANKFPKRWEQLFAFIFRPENLEFKFKAIKES